jgi:hypothetical protein
MVLEQQLSIKLIKTGVTRNVILIGKYAIKIPSCKSYRCFLNGILGNEQEAHWSKAFKWTKKLCPVLWSSWGYSIVIMPRIKVLTDEECNNGFLQKWLDTNSFNNIDEFILIEKVEEEKFPVEKKSDSFGWLNERLVIIDYGS